MDEASALRERLNRIRAAPVAPGIRGGAGGDMAA